MKKIFYFIAALALMCACNSEKESPYRAEMEEYAKKKLVKKNLDFIVANDVSASDAGFAVDNNRVQIYTRYGGCEKYPLMSKQELAGIILNKIAELMS
jgi:phosphopantothenoylcysteine decarboxylase/phosphopantothenate--cysteine ligase